MITEIKVEVDFLEHLLNCLANQKYIVEQSAEEAEQNQAIIDKAWQTGMDLISPILIKNNIAKYALEKFNEKWEQDLNLIFSDMRNEDEDKICPDKFIQWGLVRQECEMYCLIGEQVKYEELYSLCKARGLDTLKKNYIIETMKYVGLGEKL